MLNVSGQSAHCLAALALVVTVDPRRSIALQRHPAGNAAILEVDRARAVVEQRNQQVASAELQVAVASRALRSASGVIPDLSSSAELDLDLRSEAPLSEFEKQLPALPAVAAAARARQSADPLASAQRLTLAPSITGYFAETGSNAPGFAGHDWSYQAGVTLTWSLDLTTFADIRRQDARADAERARELRTSLSSGDAIHQQWNTVASSNRRRKGIRHHDLTSATCGAVVRTRGLCPRPLRLQAARTSAPSGSPGADDRHPLRLER